MPLEKLNLYGVQIQFAENPNTFLWNNASQETNK